MCRLQCPCHTFTLHLWEGLRLRTIWESCKSQLGRIWLIVSPSLLFLGPNPLKGLLLQFRSCACLHLLPEKSCRRRRSGFCLPSGLRWLILNTVYCVHKLSLNSTMAWKKCFLNLSQQRSSSHPVLNGLLWYDLITSFGCCFLQPDPSKRRRRRRRMSQERRFQYLQDAIWDRRKLFQYQGMNW